MLLIIHAWVLHYIGNMRVALVLGVCLAFVCAVESFVEDESFEDEEENETGHHLRKVRWQLSVIKLLSCNFRTDKTFLRVNVWTGLCSKLNMLETFCENVKRHFSCGIPPGATGVVS